MRPYGHPKVDRAPLDVDKRVERMRVKLAILRHIRGLPPILANGLEKVCREQHVDGDVSGCVEDELALEDNTCG